VPLNYFGPNRMAAQQYPVDSGTSLVKNRPSWGLGPQGMPGAFDYDPSGMESRRGGQGGYGVRAPNAYERGGFFWNGSGVSQGTPIAHQDQRMRLAEDDNIRRYAEQALKDKAHGLQVRDVDARIRQADAGQALNERHFGVNTDFAARRLDMEGSRLNADVSNMDRRFGLDERKLGVDTEQGEQRLALDWNRVALDAQLNPLRKEALQEQIRIGRNADTRAGEVHGERKETRDYNAGVKEMDFRRKGLASSSPERFYSMYERLSGLSAYNAKATSNTGKPVLTPEALQFIGLVDELAADPRLAKANEQAITRLASSGAKLGKDGEYYVQLPDGGFRRVTNFGTVSQ